MKLLWKMKEEPELFYPDNSLFRNNHRQWVSVFFLCSIYIQVVDKFQVFLKSLVDLKLLLFFLFSETTSASEDQQSESSSSNSASTCISRGTSPYVRLQQKRTEQLDRLHHELSLQPGINTVSHKISKNPRVFFYDFIILFSQFQPTFNKDTNEIETSGKMELPPQDDNLEDKDLSWSAMTSGPSVEEDSGNVDPSNSLDTTFPIMSQDSLGTYQYNNDWAHNFFSKLRKYKNFIIKYSVIEIRQQHSLFFQD